RVDAKRAARRQVRGHQTGDELDGSGREDREETSGWSALNDAAGECPTPEGERRADSEPREHQPERVAQDHPEHPTASSTKGDPHADLTRAPRHRPGEQS